MVPVNDMDVRVPITVGELKLPVESLNCTSNEFPALYVPLAVYFILKVSFGHLDAPGKSLVIL